ncbi:MAG: DUF3540 domain-containing protein [Polyangiaceae bacterium]
MSKSNVAILIPPESAQAVNLASPQRTLGPAEVLAVRGASLEVRLESGATASAAIALASPWEPAVGDTVLVISELERCYVIGVLMSQGRTVYSFQGDVELRSSDGVVKIAGAKGVEISGPDVALTTARLRVVAESVVERVTSLTQRVRDLVSVHVGRRHEIVDGASLTQAKSATFVTEDDVKINGKAIHLG